MAGRSRDHEQVPDEMVVSDALSGEERESACVGESAGEYQKDSGNGNQHHDWLDCYHRKPAHEHVQHDRDSRMTRALSDLQSDADNRQRPNYREHRPSPWTTQHAQGERRVRARDQKKDRGVIEDAKDLLRCFVSYRVIKRRREIEQHHRSAKHAHAHKEANVAHLDRRQD